MRVITRRLKDKVGMTQMLSPLKKLRKEAFWAKGWGHGVVNVDVIHFSLKIIGDSGMK
jgi:hypothetical protein